ncbi:SGNH/GDSL hydrolase family protein [Subtercola boreus]|nr:SGNH/GDSL hydrolase family protein [Subtercola boreus]
MSGRIRANTARIVAVLGLVGFATLAVGTPAGAATAVAASGTASSATTSVGATYGGGGNGGGNGNGGGGGGGDWKVDYVALGDSYSSGIGLTPASGVTGCDQSSSNYPHKLAQALKLNLTDVSCAGAAADNVWKTPQTLANGSTVPVQTAALSAKTAIVTITVGGNGLKFTDIAKVCAAKSATGPLYLPALSSFPNCQSYFAFTKNDLAATISGPVATDLAATYAAVKAAAPNAKVFVLGYPSIAPATASGSCFTPLGSANSFPFTDSDTPYLHGIETLLASTVKSQAQAAGFTYVPTFEGSVTHSVCSKKPYVNGVVLDPTTFISELSLHPNSDGMQYLAVAALPGVATREACVLLNLSNFRFCK